MNYRGLRIVLKTTLKGSIYWIRDIIGWIEGLLQGADKEQRHITAAVASSGH